MGSSGTGRFSDYSEQKSTASNPNSGGKSKIDKCDVAFACSLEDVSRCDYYKLRGIPPIGTEVLVRFNNTRLAVIETNSRNEIGYLPTKFNYIKNCIDSGYTYGGIVRTNSITPTPSVFIDITPI